MSNYTIRQKLDTSILILKGMKASKEGGIATGLSKSWLSKQIAIQESIVSDHRAKFEAEKFQ